VTSNDELLARCDVLHLTWSGRIGGIERTIEGIARTAATQDGRSHRVCFLDGSGPIGDRLVEEGLAARLLLRRGFDVRGLVRLARLLRRSRPHVLHFHTHAIGTHVAAFAALPKAIRVYTEHSPRALRRDRKFALLYVLLRRTVARFCATSAAMAEMLVRGGVDPQRVVVVPYGLPVARRGGVPAGDGTATVGLVARLERQKRVDLFLEVLAELRRRGVACRGIVVGHGSLRADLDRQQKELGLVAAVHFAGEQQDVVPWLDRLDVFLVTSEFEPFGIAALEALARGVPVVAMPCPGGLADLAGRGGLLLPDREIATAADAVRQLLQSAAERERLRARGDAILEEHGFERLVDMLNDVYLAAETP
jgi:glycosyltransferase involved in cell wall biosynthesis